MPSFKNGLSGARVGGLPFLCILLSLLILFWPLTLPSVESVDVVDDDDVVRRSHRSNARAVRWRSVDGTRERLASVPVEV